jgi:hypothetical protein
MDHCNRVLIYLVRKLHRSHHHDPSTTSESGHDGKEQMQEMPTSSLGVVGNEERHAIPHNHNHHTHKQECMMDDEKRDGCSSIGDQLIKPLWCHVDDGHTQVQSSCLGQQHSIAMAFMWLML